MSPESLERRLAEQYEGRARCGVRAHRGVADRTGLGSTARVVARFGLDSLTILDKQPRRLLEVKDIRERVSMVAAAVRGDPRG